MVNRWLIFILLLCFSIRGATQVSMAIQVPPSGIMQKSQLWNLVAVSAESAPVLVYLRLTLLSTKDNTPLMTATTKDFLLSKGAKHIGKEEVAPVQYNYSSAAFNADLDPNGLLPAGNYLACYTLIPVQGKGGGLAEECIPVEVAPLSPPQLNMPLDKDTITTGYPQFSWLPPMPLNMFNDLAYDLLVTEVFPGQSASESIQNNIPVYSEGNLRTMVNMFPASNKALDTSKWYAWRIVANNNHQLVAQSDIWMFRVAGPQVPANAITAKSFMLVRPVGEAGGINYVNSDSVGIKFYSFNGPYNTSVRITRTNGTLVREMTAAVAYGDNYFRYPLGSAFEKGTVYRIEVIDSELKSYTALFSIL